VREKKEESNLSLLALYLAFFLLPFFFFPVELLDTIATSNLQLLAISLYKISYALMYQHIIQNLPKYGRQQQIDNFLKRKCCLGFFGRGESKYSQDRNRVSGST